MERHNAGDVFIMNHKVSYTDNKNFVSIKVRSVKLNSENPRELAYRGICKADHKYL